MRLIPSIQKPDYDKEVLTPLRAAQALEKIQADKQAALDAEAARQALEASQQAAIVEQSGAIPTTPPTMAVGVYSLGDLIGSVGYSLPYGNCVLEPGVNNPGWGNPIDWPATSYAPWVGASALFYTNHVAVVSGLYGNGDLEVRQQNSPGMPHRVPMGMIRGFR